MTVTRSVHEVQVRSAEVDNIANVIPAPQRGAIINCRPCGGSLWFSTNGSSSGKCYNALADETDNDGRKLDHHCDSMQGGAEEGMRRCSLSTVITYLAWQCTLYNRDYNTSDGSKHGLDLAWQCTLYNRDYNTSDGSKHGDFCRAFSIFQTMALGSTR
ncbi:hypothetical protein AMATHDRAFT_68790 [Amanita thiersii Skay4041]|uniref:Uncharacterized protein n=1 Tax=Amanita thiersii Skay4041 TaxID=703135 RepID=A0A2A9N9Z8_9AGAR|nr:hypothetical protein AMATHDRAFT_68790 [Amanita thiersii Skay4041]